jgi:hypothetical protein
MGVVETIKANKIPFTQLFFSLEKNEGKCFFFPLQFHYFAGRRQQKEKIKYNNYKTLLAVVTLRRREAKSSFSRRGGEERKKNHNNCLEPWKIGLAEG